MRGDNTGALSLTNKLRPKGPTMAIIAREIALILARLSFPPKVHHAPGVPHVLVDTLSRVTPNDTSIFTTHLGLKDSDRHFPAVRNKEWYVAWDKA